MTLVIFLIYFVGAILCETTADSIGNSNSANASNTDTDTSITRTTTDNVADIHAELNEEAQRYPSVNNLYHLGFHAGIDAAGKRLVPKIGSLRKDLKAVLNGELFRYKTTLTARTRIEIIIKELFPKNIRKPESIKESMMIILKSGSPFVRKMLDSVLEYYGQENPETSIRLFSEAVELIYGQTSSVGAHNVMDSEILAMFGNAPDEKMYKILDLFHVPNDPKYIKAMRILSKEIPVPNDSDTYQATLDSYTCIKIAPSTKKPSTIAVFNQEITEEDVKAFFPTTGEKLKPHSISFERNTKNQIRSIEVNFGNLNDAVTAFSENHGWFKRNRAISEIVACQPPRLLEQKSTNETTTGQEV